MTDIVAPSGLSGQIREFQGSELNLFSNKDAHRKEITFDRILENCWLETHSGGKLESRYFESGSNCIKWDNVLVADSFYILVQIASVTWGYEYPFYWRCDVCEKRQEWEVVIDKDLKCQPFPAGALDRYLDSNEFELVLPDGRHGTHGLITRAEAKEAQRKIDRARHNSVTYALTQRVTSVEGVDQKDLHAYFEDMSAPHQLELIDDLDRVDAGYQSVIEIDCEDPTCRCSQDVRIPFDTHFWIRRRRQRTNRR